MKQNLLLRMLLVHWYIQTIFLWEHELAFPLSQAAVIKSHIKFVLSAAKSAKRIDLKVRNDVESVIVSKRLLIVALKHDVE